MSKKRDILIVIFSTIIFTFLFHREDLGLNLFIFETIFFAWLLYSKRLQFKTRNQITVALAFITTSIATVVTHSVFSYFINYLVMVVFVGLLIYPQVKSLLNAFRISIISFFKSQIFFFESLLSTKVKGKNFGSYIWKFRMFFIPLIIIIIFIAIYSGSNPVFNDLVSSFLSFISESLLAIFKNFDFLVVFTLIVGLVISNFMYIIISNKYIENEDLKATDSLVRVKKSIKRIFSITALKNEYKAGVFLLIVLNVLLLIVNCIDLNIVWFNFQWDGYFLKQFVHEGTYLLILSILISIALVLYFFRGNLNFYQNNKLLRVLSYVWIIQNAILTLSVFVRNYRYIDYFALAYKRIGVILFLLLVLYGLYSVFVKVRDKKSAFYLFRVNTYALFIVLVFSSFVNWDGLIAKYNFNNANKSFLHLNYMATLSDKALPHLDKPIEELDEIYKIQQKKFPFEEEFMRPFEYRQIINNRKKEFKTEWESKSFLEWNYAEYVAYKALFGY